MRGPHDKRLSDISRKWEAGEKRNGLITLTFFVSFRNKTKKWQPGIAAFKLFKQ